MSRRQNTEADFWAKVDKTDTCWLWTAGRWREGYANFKMAHKAIVGHRYAYELLVGPIPVGLVLDHLCRVRHCVNPAHLEPVTDRVNILRGSAPTAIHYAATECVWGHPFSPENTRVYVRPRGPERVCRSCERERQATRAGARPVRAT